MDRLPHLDEFHLSESLAEPMGTRRKTWQNQEASVPIRSADDTAREVQALVKILDALISGRG